MVDEIVFSVWYVPSTKKQFFWDCDRIWSVWGTGWGWRNSWAWRI